MKVMIEVGLRELRQDAGELVRRAQAGERVIITVAGRPATVLGPVSPRAWQRWEDLAVIVAGPADPDREHDRDLLDESVIDPRKSRWSCERQRFMERRISSSLALAARSRSACCSSKERTSGVVSASSVPPSDVA